MLSLKSPYVIDDEKANRHYELTLGLAEGCSMTAPDNPGRPIRSASNWPIKSSPEH